MRLWYLVIVLSFIAFVIAGKPSTSTSISQPLVAQAATEVGRSLPSKTTVVSKPTLETRMFDFFAAHPDPAVHEDLPNLIRTFQVRTDWSPKGVSASFLRYIDRKTFKVHSVFVMSPELVEKPNDPYAQLVVYHEYQHYLQWIEGTIPEEAFLYVPWPAKDLPRICKQKWYAEREAYHEACAFGRANGLLGQLDPREGLAHICAATEEQFVPVLKRILPLGDPSAKACANTWSTL